MEIRRFDVWSVSKMMAVMYAILGFLVGLIYAFFLFLFGAAAAASGDEGAGAAVAVMGGLGVGVVILFPILYGLLGLIGGALSTWLYNVLAGRLGGVRFEVTGAGAASH